MPPATPIAPRRRPIGRGRPFRRLRTVFLAAGLLGAFAAGAQAPGRELLNSERIEQAFGNYGIEVLTSDGRARVSNLYSTQRDEKTCRTFAVVLYPATVDPAVAAEHASILSGGSMGAVFAARGWRVLKTHLAFREMDATPRLASLMHVAPGTRLAEHAYVLDVEKGGQRIEYAALVEIHHPDYLRTSDLERIYGPANPGTRGALLQELLSAAARAAR
ncbi:MAG TPA: hypothetical protein VHH11_18860 [Gammaproteobacteria bacterium]|nr:hypothetical protein [Gammaproteobacteria bacterium]